MNSGGLKHAQGLIRPSELLVPLVIQHASELPAN